MTSQEFVLWLKGFVAGSNNYQLTPQGWDELRSQLNKVNDIKTTTQNINKDEGTTNNMS